MSLELALGAVAGIASGISGFIPFFHANTAIQLAQSLLPVAAIAAFAISISFSRLCLEAFAATFLFLPSESQATAALPAQRMAQKGKGLEAIRIAANSFLVALLASIALLPAYAFLSPSLYGTLKPFVPILLLLVLFALVSSETTLKKALAGLLVFAIAGAFGFLAFFSLGNYALFPMLAGLFGFSSILASAGETQAEIPAQKNAPPKQFHNHAVAGTLGGMLSTFLPAMSPAFVSSIAFAFFAKKGEREFIATNAGVVASKALFDIASAISFSKPRSGAGAAAMPAIATHAIGLLETAALALVAFAISLFAFTKAAPVLLKAIALARRAGANLPAASLLLLSLAILAFCGPLGLFVAGVSTAIGMLPVLWKAKRAYAIGCLVVPAIIHLSGFAPDATALISSIK